MSHRSSALNPVSNSPPEQLLRDLRSAGHITTTDRFVAMQGGRTNQVWRFGDSEKDKVLKLYRATNSNPMFDNNPNSEIICLMALDGSGLASHLLANGNHSLGHWIIYDHVNGTGWARDPAPVARLLAISASCI